MFTPVPICFARQVTDEIVIFDPTNTFDFSMGGIASHRDFLVANAADSSDPLALPPFLLWHRSGYSNSENAIIESEPVAIDTLDIEHEPLPIEASAIDVVSALEIIEHFKFDVNECNRILKRGGVIVLSTPNICSARSLANAIEGNSPCECREYHRVLSYGRIHPLEYDYSQLHSLFTQNGFSFQSLISVSFSPLTERQIFAICLNQEFCARFRSPRTTPIWANIGSPFCESADRSTTLPAPYLFSRDCR